MNQAVNVLDDLLAAERASLLQRLGESGPFVSWSATEDHALVRQMLADEHEHVRDLVEGILKLRGSPSPAVVPTDTGGVHYLQLAFLMPQVIADKRRLVKKYESAPPPDDRLAEALVSRILQTHRRHLAELEKLHVNLVHSAS